MIINYVLFQNKKQLFDFFYFFKQQGSSNTKYKSGNYLLYFLVYKIPLCIIRPLVLKTVKIKGRTILFLKDIYKKFVYIVLNKK